MSVNLITNGNFTQGVDGSGNPIGWTLFKPGGSFNYPEHQPNTFSYNSVGSIGAVGIMTSISLVKVKNYRLSFSAYHDLGVSNLRHDIKYYKNNVQVGITTFDYNISEPNTLQSFDFQALDIDFDSIYLVQQGSVAPDQYIPVSMATTINIGNVSLYYIPPYNLQQQPDPVSLSSTIKDIIISTSSETLSFTLSYKGIEIASEIYTKDAEGKIYVRDLGEICRDYLTGDILFLPGEQSNVMGDFTASINGELDIVFTVIRCDAWKFYANDVLFKTGSSFRVTRPYSSEFITAKMSGDIIIKLYTFNGTTLDKIHEEVLFTPPSPGIYTIEASLNYLKSVINMYWYDTRVDSFTVSGSGFFVSYDVDNSNQVTPKCFLFKNTFGVNETLTTTGPTKRKEIVNATTGYILGLKKRFRQKRGDTYELTFGVPNDQEEYLRLRELFTSDEIYLKIEEEWVSIIITEIKDENDERLSQFTPITFTYEMSNHKHNFRL
jgi:hypothetical protein